MNAERKLGEYFDHLEADYKTLNNSLLKQGKQIDVTKDQNARMIVLRLHTETAFTNAFSLIKEVMRSMGGLLAMIESMDKSITYLQERENQREADVKQLNSENINLQRELAAVIKELNDLKRRVTILESRPPGGGSPPSQMRARY